MFHVNIECCSPLRLSGYSLGSALGGAGRLRVAGAGWWMDLAFSRVAWFVWIATVIHSRRSAGGNRRDNFDSTSAPTRRIYDGDWAHSLRERMMLKATLLDNDWKDWIGRTEGDNAD